MSKLRNWDVAIYLRKSQADRDAEREAAARGEVYDTLEKHRAELLRVARREGYNVVDIFEEVVSGGFIGERPEMQKLLKNVQDLKYDGVLVVDVDRLGRGDKMDQGRIERAFKESDTLIITPTEILDLNNESGEFAVEVKTFLARMEYKQIKKRLLAGRRRSQEAGKDTSQKPPYGYRKDKNKRLVIHEEEARIVRLIYDWCIDEGLGRVQIAERLSEMGIPSPTGRPIWSHVTVRKILGNPKYKGDQVFGRVKWTKQETGKYKTALVKDPGKLTIVEAAHEPIIPRERWDKAQEIINGRRRASVRDDLGMVNPLATILRCKKCGNAILANNPANRPSIYLYCDTPRCPQKRITLHRVEEVMLQQLNQLMSRLKVLQDRIAKRQKARKEVTQLTERRIRKLKDELAKKYRQRDNLHDLLEDGTYTKEMFLERSRKVQESIDLLEKEISEAEQDLKKMRAESETVSNLIPALARGIEAYQLAETAEEKNRILKSFIKEMRYNREKDWNGPYQFELEIELYE
jgi:DNA invertase Pin-like site-specific DNA recombinase